MFGTELNYLLGVKIAFLVVILGYTFLSYIFINQIKVMERVVKKPSSQIIFYLAVANFAISVSLFLVSLVII